MSHKGHFFVPIYDCHVEISISDDILKRINNILKKIEEEPLKKRPGAYCVGSPNADRYYVFFDSKYLTVDYINHEKSHLLDFILEDCNMKPKDEARAYLDGYISKLFDKFFKVRNIKLKNE